MFTYFTVLSRILRHLDAVFSHTSAPGRALQRYSALRVCLVPWRSCARVESESSRQRCLFSWPRRSCSVFKVLRTHIDLELPVSLATVVISCVVRSRLASRSGPRLVSLAGQSEELAGTTLEVYKMVTAIIKDQGSVKLVRIKCNITLHYTTGYMPRTSPSDRMVFLLAAQPPETMSTAAVS